MRTSTSSLSALATLLLLASQASCAPHAALQPVEQECRCISLPPVDSTADAAVIQFAMTSRAHRRVSSDACTHFAPSIHSWRQSGNASDTPSLAATLEKGSENGIRGLLQFVSPIPSSVLDEIEAGEAQAVADGLGMEPVKNKELHSGAVVCRAVDLQANESVFQNPRVTGLCKVIFFVFLIACAAEIFGRVGGRLYRRFFVHRHPSAIVLNDEKPLWMSSTTFHDLKMALDDDDEDYRSSVL